MVVCAFPIVEDDVLTIYREAKVIVVNMRLEGVMDEELVKLPNGKKGDVKGYSLRKMILFHKESDTKLSWCERLHSMGRN